MSRAEKHNGTYTQHRIIFVEACAKIKLLLTTRALCYWRDLATTREKSFKIDFVTFKFQLPDGQVVIFSRVGIVTKVLTVHIHIHIPLSSRSGPNPKTGRVITHNRPWNLELNCLRT
jgi:hypothetical protein